MQSHVPDVSSEETGFSRFILVFAGEVFKPPRWVHCIVCTLWLTKFLYFNSKWWTNVISTTSKYLQSTWLFPVVLRLQLRFKKVSMEIKIAAFKFYYYTVTYFLFQSLRYANIDRTLWCLALDQCLKLLFIFQIQFQFSSLTSCQWWQLARDCDSFTTVGWVIILPRWSQAWSAKINHCCTLFQQALHFQVGHHVPWIL